MNNKLKLDTTMLQSNTAMHLMAFMLTQRDLLLQLIEVIQSYEDVINSDRVKMKMIDSDLINEINKLDEPPLRRQIKEVAEDFEYVIKHHTHAIHQRSGTKIYKKDPETGQWAINSKSNYTVE